MRRIYVAPDPYAWVGKPPVGSGQCAALVCEATGAPPTADWRKGPLVKGLALQPGAAIATFDDNGRYGSRDDEACHAALYLGQHEGGIDVVDQWVSQPPHRRTLRFNHQQAAKVDQGEAYFVVA